MTAIKNPPGVRTHSKGDHGLRHEDKLILPQTKPFDKKVRK